MLLWRPCRILLACMLAHTRWTFSQTTTLPPIPNNTCEHRSINYIDPVLPQLCHRDIGAIAGSLYPNTSNLVTSTPEASGSTTEKAASIPSEHLLSGDREYLSRTFVSFDDWKDQRAREAGQELPHEQPEHETRHYPVGQEYDTTDGSSPESADHPDVTGSTTIGAPAGGESTHEQTQDPAVYGVEKGHQPRSKDAGKTCKERFSYSSFDAGATVLKTNDGAKNAKAILVENKDSYMLLECAAASKFVIVELTDDILIDTVVLANFEFFSSMIRHFRVSVSGRYPVKLDKWTSLGTFEAKNSRDIQAFLIPNPHIWAKYVRIEFLSHYGNEYYCPVSLLRVHGTRMLDSWTENEAAADDEEHDHSQIEAGTATPSLPSTESGDAGQSGYDDGVVVSNGITLAFGPHHPSASAVLLWLWSRTQDETCALTKAPEHSRPLSVSNVSPYMSTSLEAGHSTQVEKLDKQAESRSNTPPVATATVKESPESPTDTLQSASTPTATAVVVDKERSAKTASVTETSRSPNPPPPNRVSSQGASVAKPRNATSSSPSPPSPTVQESFHKAVSKRLQLLETNVTLSLRYLEDQSRILQESQHRSERTQLARVDSFIEGLNHTLMSDLLSIREQYDHVWQSTVIALESQREQAQREILALSSRLNILADEVVFQKRMAILQAVLLLCCLLLVVFSRVPLAQTSAMPPLSFVPRQYGRARAAPRAGERLERQVEAFSGHYQHRDMFGVGDSNRVPKHSSPPSNAPFAHRGDWVRQGYPQNAEDGLGAIYEDAPITPPSEPSRSSISDAEHRLFSSGELGTRRERPAPSPRLPLSPGEQHEDEVPQATALTREHRNDSCIHGDDRRLEPESTLQGVNMCQAGESP